ncbi:putative tRNA threonylcarbamoyladenosine biosynthesis protein Gcp [Neochlamydia sp. TUME1]|nr:putative tRNA threonylcarbamoyladenosine biosynthesis protein Gcp [Neochlamydia sp. TUME1]
MLMLVLGIETTCDETACAVVKDGREILSNVVFSQIDLHQKFGGVVPELACRKHVDVLFPVIDQALQEANCKLEDIDLFSVAYGPGLIGAVLIGLNAIKTIALCMNKPYVGVNHVEAHLYAALMSNPHAEFPCLGIVLSGGHTSLIYMHEIGKYELIGQTVDDAIGEAFDKVAKIMGLPYPGGPPIEVLAEKGSSLRYPLKAGTVKGKPFDFSFSGLKTGVLYTYNLTSDKSDLAASFQYAAFADILKKTIQAAEKYNCKTLVFGGGVTNNKALRKMFIEKGSHYTQYWPSLGLSLDNAAMIAGLAYHIYKHKGKGDDLTLEAATSISF